MQKQYQCGLVTVSLNIPGIHKNKRIYKKFIKTIIWPILQDFFHQQAINFNKLIRFKGPSGYKLVILLPKKTNFIAIKQNIIKLEQLSDLFTIVDIDVIDNLGNKIARTEINIGPRICFLCPNEAKICARNKTHSTESLINYIVNLIDSSLNNKNKIKSEILDNIKHFEKC